MAHEFSTVTIDATKAAPLAAASGNWYDTNDRKQIGRAYRSIIEGTAGTPMQWTGRLNGCVAGDTAQAFKDAVIARVNFFRAMAGIPAGVALNPTLNAKAQAAALIMGAEGALSHFPTANWACYSNTGALAAASSNLALGTLGDDPGAIAAYINDEGSNNTAVGHRRWILYPQSTEMGTGDVDQVPPYGSRTNALWVLPATVGARPATRDTYVAWPPPGYVPHPLIYRRWSFSYPGASFNQTTVTVKRQGAAIPITLEPQAQGYGENTIVWVVANPGVGGVADVRFQVNVNNVQTPQGMQSFQYEVVAMEPALVDPDETAVFFDSNGALRLTRYGDQTAPATGSGFAGMPASARTASGDTVAVIRDSFGALWLNRFSKGAWGTWIKLGGVFKGNPAITVGSDNIATIVARDQWDACWARRQNLADGSGQWIYLGGVFASDLSVATGRGQVFVVGRDKWGGLWLNAYTAFFLGWQRGGGEFEGVPAVAVGTDALTYVAARDKWGGVWVGQAHAVGWVAWKFLGGITQSDPSIVSANDQIRTIGILERDPYGTPFMKQLSVDTLEVTQDWVNLGGSFQDVMLVNSTRKAPFLVGRDPWNGVWWQLPSTNEWSRVTDTITAKSPVR